MHDSILVTGATGALGNEVMQLLIDRGLPIKAAARNPSIIDAQSLHNVETVLFDYEHPNTFEPALVGVERLLLVPPPLTPNWHELLVPLVDTAARMGVQQIVVVSAIVSADCETFPLRMAERCVEQSGIAFTHLRPNWFMQTYNSFLLNSINGHDAIQVPAANAKITFIDMRDIAAVAAAVLTTDGHMNAAYTLTGHAALDHYEVAQILSDATGRSITYFPISDDQMRESLAFAGLPGQSIEMVIDLYRYTRLGLAAALSPNVKSILGREPRKFENYARDYASTQK